MESLKEDDDTLMGYRDEIDGVVKGIGYCGYTWISDDTSDKYASSVCRVRGKRGGGSGQVVSSRNSGHSVIPIFG